MNIVLGILFSCMFLYINFLIIKTDIEERRIPNIYLKYLVFLVPFFWIYIYSFSEIESISILSFIIQTLCVTLAAFLLFYFRFWGAGDAKYIIILHLFIPHINSFTFLGNTGFIIIGYMALTYIYFYGLHILFQHNGLGKNIVQDIGSKLKHYSYNASYKSVARSLFLFIILFISIRIYKIYITGFVLNHTFSQLQVIVGCITLFFLTGCVYFAYKKYKGITPYLYIISICTFSSIFLIFLIYEYIQNTEKILSLLYQVSTLYFGLYLLIKIIKYSISIYTGQDYYSKSIIHLEVHDIIERSDFNKKILPLIQYNKKILNYYNIPSYGNIILDAKIIQSLKSFIRSINKNDQKENQGKSVIKDIKCMKTFAFAPYLFLGIIVTFGFEDILLQYIYSFLSKWLTIT